jgi:hypothetical protein
MPTRANERAHSANKHACPSPMQIEHLYSNNHWVGMVDVTPGLDSNRVQAAFLNNECWW